MPISDKSIEISKTDLSELVSLRSFSAAKWEKMWGGKSERFELEGGAGEVWTKQEQQAAARKGTRQLTRDDPVPQTIYRISASDNKALLVNVGLRYAK